MATSGRKVCIRCGKSGGVFTCDGCEKSFCGHHTAAHRQELAHQLDVIGQEHDLLRRDLTENTGQDLILNRINTWENESIIKIKMAAVKARTDLYQFRKEIEISCSKVSDELRSSRELDSYSEIDLNRWMEKLQILRNQLENPTIEQRRDADSIDLIRIYQTHTINTTVTTSERFDEVTGSAVTLSQDRLTVTNTGIDDLSCLASISGAISYSSGLHRIHFEITRKNRDYLFFGIKSSLENLITTAYCQSSTYGWWDVGYPVMKGNSLKHHTKNVIKTGDKITLILDCDQGQISYISHPTRQTEMLYIETNSCPLPWKFLIVINTIDDSVRLLPDESFQ